MSVYKVPQDVEAEDKLIGPFGFRQFVYLMIAASFGFVAFLLARIFIGLVIIPAPIILFFLAIALPLRKDQPTEVYLAAVIHFFLKSKKRMWQPDGVVSTVTITAPKTVEPERTKNISEDEAVSRLGQLAQIMDTRGWASRGVTNPGVNSTGNVQLNDDVVAEADHAEDIMDASNQKARSFDQLIDQQKAVSRQSLANRIGAASVELPQAANASPLRSTNSSVTTATPQAQTEDEHDREVLSHAPPAPTLAMHQKVIQPASARSTTLTPPSGHAPSSDDAGDDASQSTSGVSVTPDILELAHNPDFSIATIAEEAHRQAHKREKGVDIKLH